METRKRRIERADVLSMAAYEKERPERRRRLIELKRDRRVEVGPFACFYFENYETMWAQVHEMLRIEKGGEAQVEGELDAYNPLIPQGRELVATLMFQIEDPVRRDRALARLGHVEDRIFLLVGDAAVQAVAADPRIQERTTPDGKTSSVHFLRFALTDVQAAAFREPATRVVLEIRHDSYGHMAALGEPVKQALARDLD